MFELFKKSLPEDFFREVCDVHCHVLPGVDDGFQKEEDAIEALQFLEQKGVSKMRLTPHFMKGYPCNTKDSILPRFEAFQGKARQKCGMQLFLGAEYMLDAGFMNHSEHGFLTMDEEGLLVLCETSYLMCDPKMSSMLYETMCDGYTPVIAHPERYQYASSRLYNRWKEKGYLFQLNLLSLTGAYGMQAMSKSHQMLQAKMYDYVGSDMHRLDDFLKFIPRLKLKTKEMDALHVLFENNAALF